MNGRQLVLLRNIAFLQVAAMHQPVYLDIYMQSEVICHCVLALAIQVQYSHDDISGKYYS